MTDLFAHQIATRALGGTASVTIIRDTGDGSISFAVLYENAAQYQRMVAALSVGSTLNTRST